MASTSPNFTVPKFNIDKLEIKSDLNSNIITFSEFSNGTAISDQYANKGIIFSGDSPFITEDGSNSTAPVLSGSPRFNGAIEGKFVDPITHKPTTVNHFELDAGYFDNLSSTRLQWFNPSGDLIREVLDSEFGIQHFSIDDENIASFRIKIVSQEDAGYAIDNISFEIKPLTFNHKFNIDKITHTSETDVSNTFTIYFKDLEANSESTLEAICDDYTFFVEDSVTPKFKELDCTKDVAKKAFKLDFKIIQFPYNLEDATVSICTKDECKKIEDIKDFFVYGTNFDVGKDGFSFKNGDWNKFMLIEDKDISVGAYFCWKFDLCTDSQTSYSGSMFKLVDSLKGFMADKDKKGAIELIGYFSIEDYTKGYESRKRNFGGVCHGLAVSAVANFNNYKETSSWGSDLNLSKTKNEITSIFKNHWNNRGLETAKPFSKKVYSYDSSNNITDAFPSLGKIGYYYISQESFRGGNNWVGRHEKTIFDDVDDMNSFHKKQLEKNKVSSFRFSINHSDRDSGGHSIIATELIKYNGHSIYVLHDNNFVNTFSMLDFEDKFQLTNFIYEKSVSLENNGIYDAYKDFYQSDAYGSYSYSKFGAYTDKTDELFIYGKPDKLKSSNARLAKEAKSVNKTFDYAYPNHISITIIGGKLLKVTDKESQKEVILNPILARLEKDKGYLIDDLLITEFLLPKNSIYEIEFQKYKQYPAFEVYVKIPSDDGQVEIINYENIATNQDDRTLATLIVGNDNTEKSIRREGESDITPDYNESFDMKITSATFLKATVLNNGVKLSWNSPNNPTLQEVVIIRKENEKPTAITDGNEIYQGLAERYTDSSARSNTKYYYGVYAVAKNGDIADGNFIYVDTHQASLFGYVNDSNEDPIANVEVILKNSAGLVKKTINTEQTDKNGYFSFPNLPLGTYLLEFSHPNFSFSKNIITVELADKSMEVSQDAIGIPQLSINANRAMIIGSDEVISWDGINIEDGSSINIKLYRNNVWETLASNLEYSKHSLKWKVDEVSGTRARAKPLPESATLRIELTSNSGIAFEKKVYISELIASNNEEPTEPMEIKPIPTLSWWSMFFLMGMLGSTGFLRLRAKIPTL